MQKETHPFLRILIWLGLFFMSHVLAIIIWSFSLPDTAKAIQIITEGFNDLETYKDQLFSLQFITHLTTFLLVAIYYITYIEKKNLNTYLGFNVKIKPVYFLLTVGLLFSCQPIVMLLIEGFKNFPLPASWHSYILLSHETAEYTTKTLLQFESPFQFFLGFLMVGIFAGFGEEITFRGIIQKLFHDWFKNIHTAIIMSSLIFSLLHGITYNLLGIWFIGALLGYIYYFTGNLWFSILFHFLNNTIQIVSLYLFQLGILKEDYSSVVYYSIPLSIISLISTTGIIFLFKKFKNPNFSQYQFITFKNNPT